MKSLPQADPVVRLERVIVKLTDRVILDVPQLTIAAGEHVALVGANGSGKSTLLRLLAGFVRLTAGQVQVLGRRFGAESEETLSRAQWRELRTEVGQVMQGLHLVPRLTARENVLIGALPRMRNVPAWRSWTRLYTAQLRTEAHEALASLGIAGLADVRADKLSGGERQKVAIARVMLQRARLILADEPTAALDPTATHEACRALLQAAAGGTLITVLHHRDLVPRLASRVIGIMEGRVAFDMPAPQIDDGRLDALYEPGSPHTKSSDHSDPKSNSAPVLRRASVAT
jgi:phosphonate transport system ATP-binding protein